jgi:hypothetical protein
LAPSFKYFNDIIHEVCPVRVFMGFKTDAFFEEALLICDS